ncbi:MAG: TetR/AcrR family transcriptional regulator [Alphaproteobacteria bacterium]|nr:TetR/AcrR family transcriptional regulator [Alphaproteobacteria bacterium]MCW5741862.1 TetR/AcrR family transcriptional regulator [Alphaproteobacteria bacterium]
MSEQRAAIVATALRLIAAHGWRDVTLRAIATEAAVPFAELYAIFPTKAAIVGAFLAEIDRQVLAGVEAVPDPDETVRDRLFDTMMRRYDALRPHRDTIAALAEGLARDPLAALALRPALMRSMAVVLEASGLTAEGFVGALRQKSLAALHASVLRTWLHDDSADLGKTMVALDSRLKGLEGWAQRLDRFGKSIPRRRRRQSPEPPAAEAEPTGT